MISIVAVGILLICAFVFTGLVIGFLSTEVEFSKGSIFALFLSFLISIYPLIAIITINPEVVKEKRIVTIVDNIAVVSPELDNINKYLGMNLKDGDIVYKVSYKPKWHAGFYFLPADKYEYEYIKE